MLVELCYGADVMSVALTERWLQPPLFIYTSAAIFDDVCGNGSPLRMSTWYKLQHRD